MARLIGGIDVSGYNTCVHPEDFFADWKGYYRHAHERRSAILGRGSHELGIRYGRHPRQILNVFWREGVVDAPLVVYFHGGGWREGHPDFYDHLAAPWVEAGAVFVSCGYRTLPGVDLDAVIDDASAALSWCALNAAQFGADPHRITVCGHSAGGHLAAMVTLTDRRPVLAPADATVVGGVYMSAPLNLIEDVMPNDPVAAHRLSPVTQVTGVPAAIVLSFAFPEPNKKSEPQDYDRRHARALSAVLEARDAPHTTVSLGRLDHVGTCLAFADTASPLLAAVQHVVFGARRMNQAVPIA